MHTGLNRIDRSKRFPDLTRAPITEAVIQWKCPTTNLDESPSLLENIKSRLPAYTDIRTQYNIEAAFTAGTSSSQFKQRQQFEGYRLTRIEESEQKKFVCQFKTQALIVSRLAPYQGWDEFSTEALKCWTEFRELVSPTEVAALSTRFISQIPIDTVDQAADYVYFDNSLQTKLGVTADSFYQQELFEIEKLKYAVKLVRTVQPQGEKDKKVLIVDIDVKTMDGLDDFTEIEDKLLDLRYLKNELFFTIMKDAEAKFGGGK